MFLVARSSVFVLRARFEPKIIIFDDSTNAVDTATDCWNSCRFAELADMTKIIACELSYGLESGVVLDNGRVHMTGTTELLAKSPIELYESSAW